eukprot:TRINITY_DN25847_c0_g1_i1.p1 TRINITY_DN25847_c0_g1~~TRINITY_DN25847_c0_g1_i1.p1  ORF type:complete len:371 (+),score=64.03 TRINITY_DN25847_c0_g1_i1:54-1166(+)
MGATFGCSTDSGDPADFEEHGQLQERAIGAVEPEEDMYWLQDGAFDYEKTTEDCHSVQHFTGVHKDIRPLLDYTYHKKYCEARVRLQDHLIQKAAAGGAVQDDLLLPWVVFTAGAMGAGKGYVTRWMEKQGCLPLNQFIIVDPDAVRQSLPEWAGYVAKDPLTAAIKTQKEAGHICEILGYKALRERRNVIFDGSLRDVEWYKVYFQKLRSTFPGIRLMILHIVAEREAVLKRAEVRGKETGRMVPREILESSMDAVPKSVEILSPCVDVALRVMNLSGQEPKLEREPTGTNPPEGVPVTCEFVQRLWKPIDSDGDGQLSKLEIAAGIAQGVITQEVVDSIDKDHDGSISAEELTRAKSQALRGGSLLLA